MLVYAGVGCCLANMVSKAGIKVWASQKEKTSLGPVMSSCKTFHVSLNLVEREGEGCV